MKKLLLLLPFLLPVTCFALNAPGGDPWFLYNIQINKDSLPKGLIASSSAQQAVYFGTDSQKINEIVGLKNTTDNSAIIINTPKGDPYFLPGTSRQKNNFILPPELSKIKLNVSSTSELYISKLQDGKVYNWSYLAKMPRDPIVDGSDFSKRYYEWDWDEVGADYPITQDFLISQGLDITGVFPNNAPDREITSIRYSGYKRPENVAVPEKHNFSFPIFYNGKEVNVNGTITYSLNPNYKAPDWTFSDDPSGTTKYGVSSGNNFWLLETLASMTGLIIITVIGGLIYYKNKRMQK